MPRVVVLVGILVLGLSLPAHAVMPPPVRLALMFDRVAWAGRSDVAPAPAWQIAFEWSPNGSHR